MAREKKWYGWQPDLPNPQDKTLRLSTRVAVSLPQYVDLRNKLSKIPIINQGNLGSCTACAVSTAHMAAQIIEKKLLAIVPSKLFIYYNEREMEGSVSYDSGAQIRDGIKSVVKQGVCSEKDWPYNISRFKVKPTAIAYKNAQNYQGLQYERLDNRILDQLLTVLAQGYPFVFGFTVYESFESQAVAKTGLYAPDSTKEEVLGGHAVTCFGYDQKDKTFLIRNSWGPNWGMAGYFRMKFSDMTNPNMCDDFWLLRTVE